MSDETLAADTGQRICGCGHKISDHDGRCQEWWRYPDVLDARQCGCLGVWKPDESDSRYQRWRDQESRA